MQQVRADLWVTRPDIHSERLVTHAHLWIAPDAGNIMFHNTGTDADLDEIERLGGIAHQYLSHRDVSGPMLVAHAARFGTQLHSPELEADDVARVRTPEVTFRDRHIDTNGVEVTPAPGHSPGSTCFQVTGADDAVYLFTGDTIFHRDGRWRVVLLGQSDSDAMFRDARRAGRVGSRRGRVERLRRRHRGVRVRGPLMGLVCGRGPRRTRA
ncbi:MAG: MBL fold metallo-hydrolase [Microthrixaceae bacterium]|nr:MBL fold metallo-hydrolase [Microthrixaceae bacterium]